MCFIFICFLVCLCLAAILRDWETFFSLLLRESDSLITSALADCHISTLLRLLVCSAGQLYQWRCDHLRAEEKDQQQQAVKAHGQGRSGKSAAHVEDFDEEGGEERVGVGSKRKRHVGGRGDQEGAPRRLHAVQHPPRPPPRQVVADRFRDLLFSFALDSTNVYFRRCM